MRPPLNFKVMNGLVAIDRLLMAALVRLPSNEAQDEIAVARHWIRRMGSWWDEERMVRQRATPVPPEAL